MKHKKSKKFLIICFTFFSLSLFILHQNYNTACKPHDSLLVHLTDSAHIIRQLIEQKRIGDLLEGHDQQQLDLLLDNKSPAQMALEVEVLSSTASLVVVYYFQKSDESADFIKQLEQVAARMCCDTITSNNSWLKQQKKSESDRVKFVLVDAERLFSLVYEAQIEELPTILLVKNREIVDQLSGDMSAEELEKKLDSYL